MLRSTHRAAALVLLCTLSAGADTPTITFRPEADRAVTAWLGQHLADLVTIYKDIHTHPELSLEEARTARLVAAALRDAGYEVTEKIGGHGVVGLLRNGPGPTVLIRGDMDALPIIEETGLPWASQIRVERDDGAHVGVMHACGHDIHTTTLIGTARILAAHKNLWSGTAFLIAQPAEEIGKGAEMMIADGLFERFPRPDCCISLHVLAALPATHVSYAAGWAMANVDSVDVTFFGPGGHGARPHEAPDPVVAAAHFITAVQTLVSRRVDPTEPAVITVGSVHGGSKHNIIPTEVKLQLTVRSYTDDVRQLLLAGIRQLAADTGRLFLLPQPPEVTLLDEHTPAGFNDPALTAAAADLFRQVFGHDRVVEGRPEMGGEDFGRYSKHLGVPGFMFRVGSVTQQAYDASLRPDGPTLPSVHSSRYTPVPEVTLETSLRAMGNLALALLAKP